MSGGAGGKQRRVAQGDRFARANAFAAAQVHTKKRDFFPLLLPHGSSIVQAH